MTDYRVEPDANPPHVETPAFPPLTAVDLAAEGRAVDERYRNFVVFAVNDHCVRLAVMEGEYRWHRHPRSDECFLVIDGRLEIDLAPERTFMLGPGQSVTIPANVVHRTKSLGRSVILCFEARDAYTDVVFEDDH